MPNRRRIRWDRLTVAAIILVILIFAFGSCVQHCSDQDSGGSASDTANTGEQTAAGSGYTQSSSTGATTVNLPVVITDAAASSPVGSVTSTVQTDLTDDATPEVPVNVMPEGYQEYAVQADQLYRGSLILVNQDNPCRMTQEQLELEQVYFASDKPDSYEISYPGHTALSKTALAQFNRLMKAYFAATGNTEIMFNYGYLEDGKEKSNPESSSGMDIQLHVKRGDGGYEYISNTAPFSWLFEHMASYGFVQRYPADKSGITGQEGSYTAIRYVGVPHAAYMADNNLCLEEYLATLKNKYTFGNMILEYSTPEQKYHIYYVAASPSGQTVIPVPKTGSYEISGNNTDGFIVTAIVA